MMRFRLHAAAQRSAEQKDGGDPENVGLGLVVDHHRDAADVHVDVIRTVRIGVHHVKDDHHLRWDNQHRRHRPAAKAGDRRRAAAARRAKGRKYSCAWMYISDICLWTFFIALFAWGRNEVIYPCYGKMEKPLFEWVSDFEISLEKKIEKRIFTL